MGLIYSLGLEVNLYLGGEGGEVKCDHYLAPVPEGGNLRFGNSEIVNF